MLVRMKKKTALLIFHMGGPRLFMTKGPAAEPTRQTETLLEHVGDNHTNVFLGNLQCSLTQLKKLLHILQ